MILVRLSLLSEAAGGRHAALASGYHGMFRLEPASDLHDATVTFGGEPIEPGHQHAVVLNPDVPSEWHVGPGVEISLFEGTHKIGEGEVLA